MHADYFAVVSLDDDSRLYLFYINENIRYVRVQSHQVLEDFKDTLNEDLEKYTLPLNSVGVELANDIIKELKRNQFRQELKKALE